MPRYFATDIDLIKFAIRQAKMYPVSTDPSGLAAGDAGLVWFNTTTGKFMVWNGTAAVDATSRAVHTGTQLASTISDFASAVLAQRWASMVGPNANVAMGGFKFTGMADGTAGQDSATYGQVLALINNQNFKAAVRVASTGNLTLSGTQTVDGVALSAADRVLVKDQTTGAQNGIYDVQAGAWTRSADADVSAELPPGSIVVINEGAANGDKLFLLATNGPITLGTTALVFSPYGTSTGEIGVGGAGIIKTGTVYDVVAGTTGTVVVGADAVDVNTARVPRKWVGVVPTATSTVDNIPITVSGVSVTFNHATGNICPDVNVRYGSSPPAGGSAGAKVEVDDVASDSNNVTIILPTAPAANNYTFQVQA